MSRAQYSAGRKSLLGDDGRHAEYVAPSLLGYNAAGVSCPISHMRHCDSDFVAQQAGRYELKDWLPAADTTIWQNANFSENGINSHYDLLAPTVPGGGACCCIQSQIKHKEVRCQAFARGLRKK